jgi:hypothetical protein
MILCCCWCGTLIGAMSKCVVGPSFSGGGATPVERRAHSEVSDTQHQSI